MQEQQAQSQGQGQDDAHRDIAAMEALAVKAHGDTGDQRKGDQPPKRRKAGQHRAGRAGKSDM